MGEKRRIRCYDDDQRTIILFEWILAVRPNGILFQMCPNRDPGDGQLVSSPKVRLHKRANGPAA